MSAPLLLFGANGQLGARLTTAFTDAGYEVTALDRAACDFATADAKKIDTILRAVDPAVIVNAAAYTAVDKAEQEQALAQRVNAEVPSLLAAAAQAQHVPLIHCSTDYVFDGGSAPYAENAPKRPLNVYGESKRAGEEAVLQSGGYVFRLQWVYDRQGRNFYRTARKLLTERSELSIVADQIGAPSSARDIAGAMVDAAAAIRAGTLPPGAYHLAARGHTSWHGFACAIAALAQSKAVIAPITSAEYPLPAARPTDTRLDTSLLARHGITLPHWREGLKALMEEHPE